MRNALVTTLSLMLFVVVVFQTTAAVAQHRTCNLRFKVIETNKDETDEFKPINGTRAVATKMGSRKIIPAVMLDGQPQFPKLTEGEFRITITKPGFKRTVQQVAFICPAPNQNALGYIKLERGNSKFTVVNEKLTMRASVTAFGSGNPTIVTDGPPLFVDKPPSSSRIISGGVLNGKAISLPRPPYPAIARTAGASGTVTVQVLIDQEGNVISAAVVSGHPLLRAAALQAARAAKFSPTTLDGQPVRVSGVIIYNFKLQPPREPKAVTD